MLCSDTHGPLAGPILGLIALAWSVIGTAMFFVSLLLAVFASRLSMPVRVISVLPGLLALLSGVIILYGFHLKGLS